MEKNYTENEAKLLHALIERNGMQSIVDAASAAFGNPVFVCDLGYKIICHSDQDAEYDEFWEHMKNHNYSIPEQISQIMRTGDFAKIYSSDAPRIGRYPFADAPFLAARVRDGSQTLGHICVYGCRHPFEEQDKDLLILLCKVVSYEMLYRGLSTPYQIPYYTLFSDLLEGTLTDQKELEMRLQCLKLPALTGTHLAIINFRNPTVQATIFYIREYLMQRLHHSVGMVYKDHLVFLIPETHLENHLLEKSLAGYETNIDYKIGISNAVDNLLNLSIYYEQAQNAIKISETLKMKERLCPYHRLFIYQILLLAGKETNLRFLCNPAILEMQAYDRQHHTEYLNDLKLYLKCGKNINKTANLACVHKNSMYYRISKLEEKFSLSLADEDTCFSLQLSLKILQLLNL